MDIRSLILNQPLKREDLPTPFWSQKDENGNEQVDGHIAMCDIPASELEPLQKALAQEPLKLSAAATCRALINKDTGERLFSDTDRDALLQRGTSELFPLFKDVAIFLGLNVDMDTLKKTLEQTLNGSGGTVSPKDARLVP